MEIKLGGISTVLFSFRFNTYLDYNTVSSNINVTYLVSILFQISQHLAAPILTIFIIIYYYNYKSIIKKVIRSSQIQMRLDDGDRRQGCGDVVMCRQHQRTGVGAWWQRRRQSGGVGRHPGADGDLVSSNIATAVREAATLQVDAPHARNVWLLWLCLCLSSLTYGPLAMI